MAYTFDAAKAADRRRTQYYELWGNRGIYQDGWMAVVQHNSAPWEITKRHSFEDDKWELYDLRSDFSESRNVAASHPEKLAALQAVRSEEHPSELQSLMRISYAVFCLKKKKT